jgi:hypothetical protein
VVVRLLVPDAGNRAFAFASTKPLPSVLVEMRKSQPGADAVL